MGGYEGGKGRKADELFLREDLQLIKYPTELEEIPFKYRKSKIKPPSTPLTEETKEEQKQEEAKEVEITDEVIQVEDITRSRKAKTVDLNNPQNFIGRRIKKKFGNDYYVGDITEYDKPYFHVLYEDGDEEDLNLNQVKKFLIPE